MLKMAPSQQQPAVSAAAPARCTPSHLAQMALVLVAGVFLGAWQHLRILPWCPLDAFPAAGTTTDGPSWGADRRPTDAGQMSHATATAAVVAGTDEPLTAGTGPTDPCDSSRLDPIPELLERAWIYDALSPAETVYVANWFIAHADFPVNASMAYGVATGNALSGTEAVVAIPPPKAMARAYVDGLTNDPPPRMARVTVVRGLASPPDVMEYQVGPLHGCDAGNCSAPSIPDGSPITPLTQPGQIPFAKRPYDLSDDTMLRPVYAALKELMPMLTTEFGYVWDWIPGCAAGECWNDQEGRSILEVYNDISSNNVSRISKYTLNWYSFGGEVQAQWLHELPLFMRFNQTGADPSKWFLFDWTYCANYDQVFATATELLQAWQAHSLPSCYTKANVTTSGSPGDWDTPGLAPGKTARHGSTLTPPVQSCSRRRFSLGADKGGNNGRLVSWLGWTFFTTVRPATGLALMDLRFKGQRIAHELAMAEAVAYYSGAGGDQVMYLDSAYSMTQMSAQLIPGVDCPSDAAWINGTMFTHQDDNPTEEGQPRWRDGEADDAAKTMRSDATKAVPYRAACVYERDTTASLWRHTELQAPGSPAHGVRGTALVVRMISTVANYDYLTEVEFSADGTVKVSLIFAGYCEVRWYSNKINPWESSLGGIVHDNVAAPLHSHFGSFRVDLDVLGETNSFETTTFKTGKPSGVPNLDKFDSKYVERVEVPTEGIGVSTGTVGRTMWRIINNDPELSQYGSTPGYAIMPVGSTWQDLPADHPMVQSAAFSKYNIAVTKYHDAEQRVTSVYDLFGQMSPPLVSLDNYLADGESLHDEDLVAWVSIGKEHLPRTEDVPLINNFGISFNLMPWNVFNVNGASQELPLLSDKPDLQPIVVVEPAPTSTEWKQQNLRKPA